ncbi:putative glutamate--cysteine ligase 2-3 [Virgisporangium aliadipatigenens]|uniref:Putative glutamate--cysteine ligase 2 n=1 Tax=Virgisporangium aliadipatigenens TaxID=741659 RepID=A0A8J4DNU4_9ACTN|nr:glutamate--cysteine ligase [Virgisporangium aliadipatigenens]GIJ45265.1 putative glutamate--cysteine ligase 2-3 [Virgisporangium aliadipatigenens]
MTSLLRTVGDDADTGDPDRLTIGVEEEFLLLDPETGINLPVAEEVTDALPVAVRDRSRLEVRRSMIEMFTGLGTDLTELRHELLGLRRAAAAAAAATGASLVAVGATPIGEPDLTTPSEPRYRAMTERYGPVARDPAVCGLQVHIGVADRDLAVRVCNHLQVWLPVVRAMTANSPFWEGADTGHASWRSVQLQRWPALGPTPYFESAGEYDETVTGLITAGVLLDASMVYWYARLSPTYPAVEVRIGDVCPTVDDTVLTVALVRAAVASAVTEIRAGLPASMPRECVTTAAHWHAARHGLSRNLIDLRLGKARPAWDMVNEFFATISPALLHNGDLELVVDRLAHLRAEGTGADRQRQAYERSGDLRQVLVELAELTVRD